MGFVTPRTKWEGRVTSEHRGKKDTQAELTKPLVLLLKKLPSWVQFFKDGMNIFASIVDVSNSNVAVVELAQ